MGLPGFDGAGQDESQGFDAVVNLSTPTARNFVADEARVAMDAGFAHVHAPVDCSQLEPAHHGEDRELLTEELRSLDWHEPRWFAYLDRMSGQASPWPPAGPGSPPPGAAARPIPSGAVDAAPERSYAGRAASRLHRLATGDDMRTFTKALAACLALSAWTPAGAEEDLLKVARASFKPIPAKAPETKGNPSSPAKIELGRMLYFDPRLSASQLISCNTCHNVSLGGADLQETSVGHGWQRGPRNAPTVLDAVFNVAQFWDGRAEDLKEQAKGPVQASVEMANSPARVVATLASISGYGPFFGKAFPGEKDPITFDNVVRAIEVFEATLLTPDAPFDRFLKGDRKALGPDEKAGLALFVSKGCVACHAGVNVGGQDYHPFGVVEIPSDEVRPPGDKGRFQVTKSTGDEYVFRASPLRNVAITQPYFHSGKVWRLEDAVRIMGSAQLGATLTDAEAARITTFLRSLTGRQPKVPNPILPPSGDGTPHPEIRVPAPG